MEEEIIKRSGDRLMCGLLFELLNGWRGGAAAALCVAAMNRPGLSNTRLVEGGDGVMKRSTGGGSIAC